MSESVFLLQVISVFSQRKWCCGKETENLFMNVGTLCFKYIVAFLQMVKFERMPFILGDSIFIKRNNNFLKSLKRATDFGFFSQ